MPAVGSLIQPGQSFTAGLTCVIFDGNQGWFSLLTTDSTGAPTDDELDVSMAADGSLGMLVLKMDNYGDLFETQKHETVSIQQ